MTDTTATDATTAEETTEAAATATTETTEAEIDYKAEAEKWKALSRQNEATAKANAEKAKAHDALVEANKTELEKANDRALAAEARAKEIESTATAAEQRATRAEVAAAKGVPLNLITGTTAEEMEAAADAALAWRGNNAAKSGGFDGSGGAAPTRTYTRAQLADPAFYAEHRTDILAALQTGRITE